MRKSLLIVIALTLVSCATTAGYEKILNSLMGADELRLVRSWGPPQQTYESQGRKFLTYSSSRNVYVEGTPPSYKTTVVGNTTYTTTVGGTPGYNVNKQCTTTFELENGKIVFWRWEGNDCKARE
jgi:hypothetical protein